MSAGGLFSPRVLVIWVAVASLLFVAMILFMLFGSPPAARPGRHEIVFSSLTSLKAA